MQQAHMCLFKLPSAFAVVAVWTGCDNVRPDMLAAQVPGHDVVHRQPAIALAAVLTGIIVPAEDFTAGQLDMRARTMNLSLQPDDRRPGQ